jgi:hypothetical protein
MDDPLRACGIKRRDLDAKVENVSISSGLAAI